MSKKRKSCTIAEKLEALEKIEKGERLIKVASDLGVGVTTVKDWKKNRDQLISFSALSDDPTNKKRLRKPASEVLDEAVWLWFCQEREKGTPLSGPLIKAKATSLHSSLNAEGDFHASEGWLHRWKKRHGIQQFTISGEKLSADQEAATAFIDLFRNILVNEELSTEQVYNLDETGLNFKMLPNKTLAAKNNKNIVGYKLAKERLTLALCSNGSGTHKLPLFVIGKSRKPRAFKNISNLSALPVHYRAQKSAWMDRELFSEWFNNVFVPEVANYLKDKNLPQKAILLLDNAPSHPTDLKKNEVRTIFFTSKCNSLDPTNGPRSDRITQKTVPI
nr:jerky protein homolog-like [Halyomorpha halys]